MQSYRVVLVCAVFLAVMPAAAQDFPSAFAPPDAVAAAIELVSEPASYEVAASDGHIEASASAVCSDARPREIDVTLEWEVEGGAGADARRVDISMFGNGFHSGRYLTSGVLPEARREVRFDGAEPGIYYYWRVLSSTADGWVVSANGRFEAPICAVDLVKERV